MKQLQSGCLMLCATILALALVAMAQAPPVQPQIPSAGGGAHGGQHGHGHPPMTHPRGPSAAPDRVKAPKAGASFEMGDFGGRPVVQVMINGRGPYRFILDTGATLSVIDPALAKELGLPEAAGLRDTTGHARTLVRANDLRVGEVELRGLTLSSDASVTALLGAKGPRGVLSAFSFPGYLLSIDYPARRISVQKGKLAKPDAQTVFEYAPDDMFPAITIRVGGQEARATVDSGSGNGLMMLTKYMKELPLESDPVVVGQARTHANSFPVSRAAVKGTLQLGKYDLGPQEVMFTDLRVGKLQSNIGFEILRKFVVTLDSRNRRIRFSQ